MRYIIVNMDDASQIPALAEPLFLGLGATIQVHPGDDSGGLGEGGPGDRASGQEVRMEANLRLASGVTDGLPDQ